MISRLEISKKQLQKNIALILKNMPSHLHYFCVVKDDALGHGGAIVAQEALKQGATYLMVACLQEAIELNNQGISSPIFILYERWNEELEYCIEKEFTIQVQSLERAKRLSLLAEKQKKIAKIHLKVDTGLGRYGVHWSKAANLYKKILKIPHLELEGIMSHLAQSDELDKSYAHLQNKRFQMVLEKIKKSLPRYIHLCNTGGYLDLPEFYYNAVRVGILNTGIYPSSVCHRIKGIFPIMEVKTRILHIKKLNKGEKVGYGMHYEAKKSKKIAILPLGYGNGLPRLRNQGKVLINGEFASIIGGISMDATIVDIDNIPQAKVGDEVIFIGKQKEKELSINFWSGLADTVCYDILKKLGNGMPKVIL